MRMGDLAPMRIAVIGAGAMGSVYAGLLSAAGNDVVVVDPWVEHVAAIAEHGLRVEGASGDRTVRLEAVATVEGLGPVELVVIATKARHVAEAARSALPLLGPGTTVLTIQNGLGSDAVVAGVVGEERTIAGVASAFGASIAGPGHAHHHHLGVIRIGERASGTSARTRRVADVWRAAGFPAEAEDDLPRLIWEKLVCNCAFSGPCALLGRPIRGVLDDPHAWSVAADCASEAYTAGRSAGVRFGFDDPVAWARAFGERMPGAKPSVLLDLEAGRPTEIAVINGSIPVVARAHGLQAPVNETVTALVCAREAPAPD